MTPPLLLAATLLALTVWTSAPLFAAPIVMSCELLEATSKTDRMAMVDQIVMDTSQRSMDLRVAKTMGTSTPVNFVYGDPSHPNEPISFLPVNDKLLIVAIRAGAANAFSLDSKGIFVMTYTIPELPVESFRWKCER